MVMMSINVPSYVIDILPYLVRLKGFTAFQFFLSLADIFNRLVEPFQSSVDELQRHIDMQIRQFYCTSKPPMEVLRESIVSLQSRSINLAHR
jgi:hypothetical protein